MKISRSFSGGTGLCAGFGLLEILIAAVILSVVFASLAGILVGAFRVTDEDIEKMQASFLAGEGLEAVRILRDKGWQENIAPLSVNTSYFPVFAGGEFQLNEGDPGPLDGVFTRTVSFEDVYRRDSDDDIVPEGESVPKTLDTGTRKVLSRVSWNGKKGPLTVEIETYITDFFGN